MSDPINTPPKVGTPYPNYRGKQDISLDEPGIERRAKASAKKIHAPLELEERWGFLSRVSVGREENQLLDHKADFPLVINVEELTGNIKHFFTERTSLGLSVVTRGFVFRKPSAKERPVIFEDKEHGVKITHGLEWSWSPFKVAFDHLGKYFTFSLAVEPAQVIKTQFFTQIQNEEGNGESAWFTRFVFGKTRGSMGFNLWRFWVGAQGRLEYLRTEASLNGSESPFTQMYRYRMKDTLDPLEIKKRTAGFEAMNLANKFFLSGETQPGASLRLGPVRAGFLTIDPQLSFSWLYGWDLIGPSGSGEIVLADEIKNIPDFSYRAYSLGGSMKVSFGKHYQLHFRGSGRIGQESGYDLALNTRIGDQHVLGLFGRISSLKRAVGEKTYSRFRLFGGLELFIGG